MEGSKYLRTFGASTGKPPAMKTPWTAYSRAAASSRPATWVHPGSREVWMSALRAKANATSTGSASGTVTYPSRRDTSSTCVFTPPQNPHKSASAVDGPHKNPTYKTALSGTRRHGCYHGLVSPGTPLCRQDRVTLLTAPGAPGRDRPSVNRQVIGSSPIAGAQSVSPLTCINAGREALWRSRRPRGPRSTQK
jgi:hypothetical protein